MGAFLLNAWYVAAWSHELGDALIARTLLEKPVLLYRGTGGAPVALADRCPHRFAPLHKGKRIGDAVQCPYHGLEFGPDGRCTRNPHGDGAIPREAQVETYPLVERDTLVWIWMGEPARADPALIPDYSVLTASENWRTLRGYLHTTADYLLVIDNLMDLSHPQYVHDGSFGSPSLSTAQYEVRQEGRTTVHSNRWFAEGVSPPVFAHFRPEFAESPIEHWANMRWDAPANLMLDVGGTLTGRPRSEGLQVYSGHFLTPETMHSTHYFYSHSRMYALDSTEVDNATLAYLRHAFANEDAPMIAAVQERMGSSDLWSLRPVLLPGDAGAVRVRRLLRRLMSDEAAQRAF